MSDRQVVHVIDDDLMLRQSIEMVLDLEGMDVRTYASAIDFLNGAREAGCVVTDVDMPGMSGVELLCEIVDRHLPFPVIVISGGSDASFANRAISLGAFEFMPKPFNSEALIRAIHAALGVSASKIESIARPMSCSLQRGR